MNEPFSYVALPSNSCFVTEDRNIPRAFTTFLQKNHPDALSETPDAADIIVFFERINVKDGRNSRQLLKDPFVSKYRKKIIVVDPSDFAHGHLPGLYASLKPALLRSKTRVSCIYYYRHNQTLYNHADSEAFTWNPEFLFNFRGDPNSHFLREKLIQRFGGDSRWRVTGVPKARGRSGDQAVEKAYTDEILNSQFCLCPRGFGPSSFRIYEAMALGRCPVILSDKWVPPSGIDWKSCSLRIPERSWKKLPAILEKESSRARGLGLKARITYETYFKGDLIWEYHWKLVNQVASRIIKK